ncbi:phytoene/squalene synthase family protein [Jiella marina]|uniref:phytoene/squalene synthase family protein n=1 Tax=Jiella sp. LLJ827 TaxID=2917712 RepID=UPI002100AEC8|nr:phytoene/squalene synthase family protein [Jiella sp. LLJ827]MCQ0986520.1 phytoene/squalene synthase family protein [Jiella sp. LLJ827]
MSLATDPLRLPLAPADRADLAAHARDTIAKGSKSFAAAARLFDRDVRQSAMMLYAWCRHCDDAIDGQVLGFSRRSAVEDATPAEQLAALEAQTLAALEGDLTLGPAFRSVADVAARHGIDRQLFIEHLEGYRMDVEGRRYATIGDTLDYCYRVAGVVGVMMALVMEARGEDALDRACDLGIAFQLTNIARDIVDDARVGRIYVPRDWLQEAGLSDADLLDPRHRGAVAGLAARLADLAEPYYASALQGLPALSWRSGWAVATAHGVYREIGTDIRRYGAAAFDGRVSTGRLAKLRHVGLGFAKVAVSRMRPREPRPQELWTRPRPLHAA